MDFSTNRYHTNSFRHGQDKPGRPLEMRDSSILAPMASSRRARAHQLAVSDTKMTPWGTDIGQDYEEAAKQQRLQAGTSVSGTSGSGTSPSGTGVAAAGMMMDDSESPVPATRHGGAQRFGGAQMLNENAGTYQVPDVSKTHNHEQNRQTDQKALRLRSATSKINEGHISAHVWGAISSRVEFGVVQKKQPAVAAVSGGVDGEEKKKEEEEEEDVHEDEGGASQQQNPQQLQQQRLMMSQQMGPAGAPTDAPVEKRHLLTSRVNECHGLWFQKPSPLDEGSRARPRAGTPKCAFPVPAQQAAAAKSRWAEQSQIKAQDAEHSHYPNKQNVSRGAVKNPWLGYTDSKEKFGGKAGFPFG